jgi:hypothetical protein
MPTRLFGVTRQPWRSLMSPQGLPRLQDVSSGVLRHSSVGSKQAEGVRSGPTARPSEVDALFGVLRCREVELEGSVGSEGFLHTIPGSKTRISISRRLGLDWKVSRRFLGHALRSEVRSRAFARRFGEAQRYAQEWTQGSSEPGGHATRAGEP